MGLHQDFKDLLSAFAERQVEYLLIGGYAVSFHARPRYTKDRRVETEWDGVQVSIVGLDDLIASKRAAGRPQDLIDVKLLERVRTGQG